MPRSSTRSVLLTAAMFAMLAVAATPAQARLTPAGGIVSATSPNSELSGTVAVRCPTAEFTGTINAGGTGLSGSLALSENRITRVTCTALGGAVSATVACTGRITLRVSSSDVRARSAHGVMDLDTGFNCKMTTSNGCVYDVRGPQNPGSGFGYTDNNQTLNVLVTDLSVTKSAGGVLCPGSTTRGTFTGDYVFFRGGPVLVS